MYVFSYRFLDLFPHAAAIRNAQKDLDQLIQEGVFQITRLLKNSESTSNSANESGETSYTSYNYSRRSKLYKETPITSQSKGRLTERLIAQGLLTPAMLQELRKEWNQQQNEEDNDSDSRRFRRKKRK